MGISIGLVGLGSFGNDFAPMFKSHPLVDRVALCEQEPERVKFWADKEAFADKSVEINDQYTYVTPVPWRISISDDHK